MGEVEARHDELHRIKWSTIELAAIFIDMRHLIVTFDRAVKRTEENAIQTQEDVSRGNVAVDEASTHARNRSKLKLLRLLLVVPIILAIALGVGLRVGLPGEGLVKVMRNRLCRCNNS